MSAAGTSLPSGLNHEAQDYQLSDDLARLCLPQEFSDACRTLAWVNSICALFLAVGLIGLKAPKVVHRPLSELTEPVPVVFTPPEEQPKPVVEEKQVEPDQNQQTETDTPQVITVVAPADAKVAFAVPVQGAVVVATEARLATPPPPATQQVISSPTRFNPNASDGGSYPKPQYPAAALRRHYEGTAIIEMRVDASGNITTANVQKSSGFPDLDEAALGTVKNLWRFPATGKERWLSWPCIFKLE